MRANWILCAMLAMVLGCDHDEYTIQMTPRGGEMDRLLVVAHVHNPSEKGKDIVLPSQQEIDRLSKLYFTSKIGPNSVVFSGAFKERLPADLGSRWGWYTEFAGTVGSLRVYMESIRGDDDLAGGIEKNFKGIDRYVDVLIGFAKSEFGKDPAYGRMDVFLDREFRKDVKNLQMLAWLACVQDSAIQDGQNRNQAILMETAARAVEYLLDRGYFKPKNAPILVKAFMGGSNEQITAAKIFWRGLVVDKLALPEGPMRNWLLSMPDHTEEAQKSFEKYVSQLPDYRKAVEQTRKENKDLTPEQWLNSGFNMLGSFLHLLATDDSISIVLACDSQPIAANGRWDPVKKQVTWSLTVENSPMPLQCFAVWAQADEKFQTRHFGKVVLAGYELVEFCLWREILSPLQKKELDEFLSRQAPGKQLVAQLEAFRFSEAAMAPVPPATQPTSQAADQPIEGVKLILDELKPK